MASTKRREVDVTSIQTAKLPIVCVMGGPGSGKGTQSEKIVEKYGFRHISTGDLLRAEAGGGSDFGKHLNELMKSGQLIPSETMLDLLKISMVKMVQGGGVKGFLLDGYPREVAQANMFEKEIQPILTVIYLEVSDETMTKRLLKRGESSGRVDDNTETIKKRIASFHQHTKPVLLHYQSTGRAAVVKAEGGINEIFGGVSSAIDSAMAKSA